MSDRLARGFERLRNLVPDGAEVEDLRDEVADDLPSDDNLVDLLRMDSEGWDPLVDRASLPRIRPVLVAVAARAAGAEQVQGEAMHTAEVLHLALQVHDLAFGRQGGKRRWLARKVVKRSVGMLVGSHLTLRALELARHSRPEVLGDAVDTLRAFADGQALLEQLQRGELPTEADWGEHADAHTGALFSFCCRAGGWLGDGERTRVTALGRYGRHVGRMWHIAEDVSLLTGADPGANLLARALAARPMLPVILVGREHPQLVRQWAHLVSHPDPDAADALAKALLDAGAVALSREAMVRESWSARKALSGLDDSRYRRALDRFARKLARTGRADS